MVGDDLRTMRQRLTDLADDGGRFYVACARTGERPFPVGGLAFADRGTAARAAELAHNYRETLETYDPRTPRYDLVVHEEDDPLPALSAPTLPDACHDVTGAVFEALSEQGHRGAERAVLDTYLAAAEATTDLDDLCVVLLTCTAEVLDEQLTPGEQAAVLRDAAGRADIAADARTPDAALGTLVGAELAESVSQDPNGWFFEPTAGGEDAVVTLPATVALLGARPNASPSFERVGGEVRGRLVGGPAGLATVGSE
jgi:hypothetical protein